MKNINDMPKFEKTNLKIFDPKIIIFVFFLAEREGFMLRGTVVARPKYVQALRTTSHPKILKVGTKINKK